ncbi:uncharacterized protein FOMMEDRAFT_92698, partial [Fomitiporia mediterranea MF3/22]|uniref:uncharacterized protein n=1 Tax=Fomitiporia mediterranea (strain MF3/22) TaxID=694068 RepID=UPI0004409739
SCSTVHENDPEVLEREKQRNLKGKQHKTSTPHKHAPGWNEYLASTSEANVKADRAEGTPEVLQKSTTEYIRARDSGEEDEYTERDIHASSELKEEIQGPLRSAKGNVADRAERSEGVHGGKP